MWEWESYPQTHDLVGIVPSVAKARDVPQGADPEAAAVLVTILSEIVIHTGFSMSTQRVTRGGNPDGGFAERA
ncbi:hypothetical protein GH733_012320 [Mirounga leonina]|nr:hypothetical protein GH733_012320 [Mirounga leonina]